MVTVLMPVRNGEKYIRESIESVLKQTFDDFEFIIIDDGSTDKTVSIIKSYNDGRIRLIEQEHDFVAALNRGLQLAEGEYVARMDADDIMHTERLRIQVKRMKLNPDITILGSWAKTFKEDSARLAPIQMKSEFIDNPVLEMLKGNFMIHPSVIIRKIFLEEHHLKYEEYAQAEDYKLWFEIAKLGGKFYIEPQNLLFFRISDSQITTVKRDTMIEQTVRIKKEIINYLIGQVSSGELESLHFILENLEKEKVLPSNEISRLFYIIFENRILNTQKNNV
jgi:glycosyltransferase involved in cell wall biosynthesis